MRFQRKTGHISETVGYWAKITITNKSGIRSLNWDKTCRSAWPWGSVLQQKLYMLQRIYPSDSWALLYCSHLKTTVCHMPVIPHLHN